jgi:hypothetical protein
MGEEIGGKLQCDDAVNLIKPQIPIDKYLFNNTIRRFGAERDAQEFSVDPNYRI